MRTTSALSFTGIAQGHFFLDASLPGEAVIHWENTDQNPADTLPLSVTDESGAPVPVSDLAENEIRIPLPKVGVYTCTLDKDGKGRRSFTITVSEGVLPFLMPGVGVVWNHGALFPLLLAGGQSHTLYPLTEDACPGAAWTLPDGRVAPVAVIKGIPHGERARFAELDDCEVLSGNEILPADWHPKLGRDWFWHSTMLTCRPGFLRCDLDAAASDVRFTLWHSPLTALLQPKWDLHLGSVILSCTDENGLPLDARFTLYKGEEAVGQQDILRNEPGEITLPAGEYRLVVSHGHTFAPHEETIRVQTGKTKNVNVQLKKRFTLPRGWAYGDLHFHSAFEDATVFPDQVMRAARACGCAFCFQTDKDMGQLLAWDIHRWDVPSLAGNHADGFLGLPGQEIMCQELHMNVLNTDRQFANPEADNLARVNPDIREKIGGWLTEYREMRRSHPCLVMHNHPSHRPEVMANGSGYFRSWWVSDLFEDFVLVENFDTRGWYDRLNRRRKLFGCWTSDSHDCALASPGSEGVCVFVGETLTEETLLNALEMGRFFALRAPGLWMNLTAGTAETAMGQIFPAPVPLTLEVRASLPIERIEWVVNGKTVRKEVPETASHTWLGSFTPATDALWCHAKVKLKDSGWVEETHSFTPLMCEGFDGYSNPVLFGEGWK